MELKWKQGRWVLKALLLLVMIGAALLPTHALAADGDFDIRDGVLVQYHGPGGNVVVPSGITAIGSFAFQSKKQITGVVIPDGVVSIGEAAFDGCSGLTSVTIPASVRTISANSFDNTPWYKGLGGFPIVNGILIRYEGNRTAPQVVVPEGVTVINDKAFRDFGGLSDIVLPESVTKIGDWAFASCGKLVRINIPAGVTSIGDYAFFECRSLGEITLPPGITEIGYSAFGSCSSLTGIVIPEGVTAIHHVAFSNCRNLSSVTLPESLTYIGNAAFSNTISLTSIDLPEQLTYIGGAAFRNSRITSVTIPKGVKCICREAFSSCVVLTDVTIPEGVITIGPQAFFRCDKLERVSIPASVTTIGGEAFYATPWQMRMGDFPVVNGTLLGYQGSAVHAVIPSGVTAIADRAFKIGDQSLTRVTIPEGVTRIGDQAFEARVFLEEVTLPSTIKEIGERAFFECTGLKRIVIPEGATSIGELAFHGCTGLMDVTIPQSVTHIGGRAFYKTYWQNRLARPVYINDILVDSGWPEVREGTKAISDWAFPYGMSKLYVPDSVTTIGGWALEDTFWIEEQGDFPIVNGTLLDYQGTGDSRIPVVVPDGVTAIGSHSFHGEYVREVILPESVTSIGERAFAECGYLERLTVPDSVTSIGLHAFESSPNLVLRCGEGSAAQKYAQKWGVRFETVPKPTAPAAAPASVAYERNLTVRVDGTDCVFQAYAVKDQSGNETNYVRIRDVASVLDGTAVRFHVGYADGVIILDPGMAYVPNGSEMQAAFHGDQAYTRSETPVRLNGAEVGVEAILITGPDGGYTYFKLRDLGDLFGFGVGWDGMVTIDTNPPA